MGTYLLLKLFYNCAESYQSLPRINIRTGCLFLKHSVVRGLAKCIITTTYISKVTIHGDASTIFVS